jgi:hypothetical protein
MRVQVVENGSGLGFRQHGPAFIRRPVDFFRRPEERDLVGPKLSEELPGFVPALQDGPEACELLFDQVHG